MGMSDWLEDYHPERLSVEEAMEMVEDAKYGMSACAGTSVFRNGRDFDEYVKNNGWAIHAMATRPNRGEIKAMDLDGNVKWVNVVDRRTSPGHHTLMVLPPRMAIASAKDIIQHAVRYHDTSYNVTGVNFLDIHEYLRPVCELSSDYSLPVTYDETTGTIHGSFKLGKVCTASYAKYIANEYGIDVSGPVDKVKPNTVFTRDNDRLSERLANVKVFHEIVAMSYDRVRSAVAKDSMALDASGLVSMVSGSEGGLVISSLTGHRKEFDYDFTKVKEYLLSMDGKKVRITDEEDACVGYFVVHSSASGNVVVTNISPIE